MSAPDSESMLLDFDGWLGSQPADIRAGIDAHLKAVQPAQRQPEKNRLASMFAVSEATGLDLRTVNERWGTVRGGYAEQQGGEWLASKDDENAFHGLMVKQATAGRDERFLIQGPDGNDEASGPGKLESLTGLVSAAAMRGESFIPAYSAWLKSAQGKPGFNAAKLDQYEETARSVHDNLSQRLASVRPAVDSILAGLTGERDSVNGTYGGDAVVDEMMKIPAEERPLAQALLAAKAIELGAGKKEGWQMWEAFGRGSAAMLTSTTRVAEYDKLDDAEQRLDAMKPGEEIGGRFDSLVDAAKGQSSDSMEGRALGFILEPLLKNKTVTAEDIATAKAEIQRQRERLDVGAQLEEVAKSGLDPIKGGNWFTRKILYPFAESMAPQIALAALTRKIAPVGTGFTGALVSGGGAMVPLYGIMADQNAQQLMQQNPGMSSRQAYGLGRRAAWLQTGTEYVQTMLGLGAGTALGQALATARKSALVNFAKFAAVGAVEQNLIEGTQDITPQWVQEFSKALGEDVPGVDWKKALQGDAPEVTVRSVGSGESARNIWTVGGRDFDTQAEARKFADENRRGGYWDQRADTFWAVLPAVIFGAGGNAARAKFGQAALERTAANLSDSELMAQGIPEDQRAAILAETDAVKRLDAFSGARDAVKRSAETQSIKAEGERRMKAEQEAAAAAQEQAMRSADITVERTTRDGAPVWTVSRGDVTTEHASAGSALAAAREHMDTTDREENGPLLEMLAELDANPLSPVQESRVTLSEPQTVANYQAERAAVMQDEAATPDVRRRAEKESAAMTRRQKIFEEAYPDKPVDWRQMQVGGQSELEVKDGVARAVLKVANGESAYTALEEKTESEAAAWVRSKAITWAGLADLIRQTESATGDKYLVGYTEGADAAADQMAVQEAYSDLSQVSATGKGRAGKAAASGVAGVARMDRMQARTNLRRAIEGGQVAPSLVARLKAHVEWLKTVVGKAIRLNRARREAGGKLAIDEFLNKSLGIPEEAQHAAEVVKEAERIYGEETYTPPTPEEEADGKAFRLTPVDTLDQLARAMERRQRDPEARRKVFEQMKGALDTLRRRWSETRASFDGEVRPLVERRTKRELDKEQAFREAAAYQDAEDKIWESLTPAAQQALGMTAEDTSAYKGPLAQRFSGGRFGAPGRIQSRSAAARFAENGDFRLGGEYDGAAGLPPMFFGGSVTADTAAQEAYDAGEIREPTPDALWDAMRRELQTQAGNRDAMKAAMASIRDAQKAARESARAEAQEWRSDQEAMQEKDWNARTVMLRHLRTLDAILSALPPEIRGKVGGWTAIAQLSDPKAMAKELEHRLQMADEHLETFLRKDARENIEKILDRAKPKVGENRVSKGKLTPETQAILDKVRQYAGLSVKEAETALVKAQEGINAARDEAELTKATDEYLLIDAVGAALDDDPGGKSAADLTEALDFIENVYVKGRTGFSVLSEFNKQQWDTWRGAVIAKNGAATSDQAQDRMNRDKLPGISTLRAAEQTIEGLFDIHQQLVDILGRDHPVTRHFSKAIRNAREAARMEIHEEQRALFEWLKSKLGAKSAARQSILLSEISRQVQSPVTRVEGRQVTTDEISIDLARNLIDGTAQDSRYPAGSSQFKALGEALSAYDKALDAWDKKPDGRRPERQYLKIDRVTNPGVKAQRVMSMLDAIQDTLTWQQARYQESNMERHGLGQEYIDQVEKWLSPEAKVIRDFIRTRYGSDSEYNGMNRTYRALFNMNMPREENYARVGFITPGMDAEPVGPDGLPSSPGGTSIGSIKGRVAHQAEPKRQNALAVRMAHVAQTAHWKSGAVTARDLRAVFSPVEVRNSIITKHGEAAYNRLMTAIRTFEAGGWRESMNHMDGHELIQRVMGLGVANSLAYNISSIMAQLSAAVVSMSRIGPVAWSKALARLAAKPSLVADIYRDNALVLRRGPVFSRGQIFAALSGQRGNIAAQAVMRIGEMGTEVLGEADAALTSISGAVAYLAHLEDAKKTLPSLPEGLPEKERKERQEILDAQAREIALDQMRQTIEETAQPEDFTRKSNFENQISSGRGLGMMAWRALFMFKGAARSLSANIFLTMKEAARGEITPAQAGGRMAAMVILIPVLTQVMRSLYRDMASDDPDDDLWRKPSTWYAAILSSFLDGVPGAGSIQDILKVQAVGGHSVTVQDPATRLVNESVTAARKAINGGEFDINALNAAAHLTALGLSAYGIPGGEALEGALNLAKTAQGVAKNLETSDEQKSKDLELKGRKKEAKEQKDAKEEARRANLTQEQRDREDAEKERRKGDLKRRELETLRRKQGPL